MNTFAVRVSLFNNNWLKITRNPTIIYWVGGYSIHFVYLSVQIFVPSVRHFSFKEIGVLRNNIQHLIAS